MNNRLTRSVLSTGVVIACVALAGGQDMPFALAARPFPSQDVGAPQSQESGVVVGAKDMGFQFLGAEPAISTQIVKGMPYSLDATVDTEQTLADGNRIVHHQIVHVYRDADGRTRREETLAAIGPWASSGTPPKIVTIQDPVSGVSYSLDPQNKIATKLPKGMASGITLATGDHMAGAISLSSDGEKPNGPVTAFHSGPGVVMVQNGSVAAMSKSGGTSESLGKETIAGVSAEGVRLTKTIPADAIGNERPIEITTERWLSPELQIMLRSRQSDPRFGVTTYEVTRLDRSNPLHSLFEVPPDYLIRKAPEPTLRAIPPK